MLIMRFHAFAAVAVLGLAVTMPIAAEGDDVSALLKAAGFQVPTVDMVAPDFTLASLDGKQVNLGALKGSLVFVNFWATWCGPCKMEIPSLEMLYEKEKGKGLVLLGVDLSEAKDEVSRFVKEKAMTFPVLLDTTSSVGQIYASQSIPMTYIIGRSGHVLARKVGFDGSEWNSLETVSLVEKLLAM
jgi:thiol-disulfide isomerase/thioredoxin